ncbi:MAG: tRNA (guanosine(37)-N1)-methyltransferase TrmD [Bacillota bacterium]|nr:tRNA (guanosine(37)-N1)-methyltransferase TrmD [Bacillota bacterium]
MNIKILTQFPEMFAAITSESILGRAADKGILNIELLNIRDYSTDKHLKTDDTPFGGGAGMVMQCQPAFDALKAAGAKGKRTIYMSPRGKVLDQTMIEELSKEEDLVILCGHYEGVDQRIIDEWNMEEVSIGDYILTGGELAAMVLVDSVSRLVPGVLGSSESLAEESIYSGLLEYPQYTKPREYEGLNVPEILCNGNHELIHLWQWQESLKLTKKRRPDLFEKYLKSLGKLSKKEKKILDEVLNSEE